MKILVVINFLRYFFILQLDLKLTWGALIAL